MVQKGKVKINVVYEDAYFQGVMFTFLDEHLEERQETIELPHIYLQKFTTEEIILGLDLKLKWQGVYGDNDLLLEEEIYGEDGQHLDYKIARKVWDKYASLELVPWENISENSIHKCNYIINYTKNCNTKNCSVLLRGQCPHVKSDFYSKMKLPRNQKMEIFKRYADDIEEEYWS